jgi:hypothetical protein
MSESRSSPPDQTSEPRPPTGAAQSRREKVQRQLDEALADSFPASDPVSIVTSNEEDWDKPEP